MATEASKFKIGLFVTLGLSIAIGGVIALGAARFFQDTRTYVTYFEESVQGLEPDSLVRYRGVPIGRVHRIRIAPDGRLVEVILKIDDKVKIDPDMRIGMRMAGITGMKYLEIDRSSFELKPEKTPQIEFRPPHPVIPSRPSDIQEILDAFEHVFRNIQELDVRGISDKLNTSLDSLSAILDNKAWEGTLRNIEETTSYLRDATAKIDALFQGPAVGDSLAHASETLKSLREISARLNADLEKLDLGERIKGSTDKFDRFADEGTMAAREIRLTVVQEQENLSALLDNLRRAAEALNNLAVSLRDNPSQLLFARPPAAGNEPVSQQEGR